MIASIRRFFRKARSAYLHGRAFRKIELGNYLGGAKLLEEICQKNPHEDNIEYSFYRLGHCYNALGNYEKAINWFSKSHKLYQENVSLKKDQRYLESYRALIVEYSKALTLNGKPELAEQIGIELQKIS